MNEKEQIMRMLLHFNGIGLKANDWNERKEDINAVAELEKKGMIKISNGTIEFNEEMSNENLGEVLLIKTKMEKEKGDK